MDYAHSIAGQSRSKWEPLTAHLNDVSQLCKQFSNSFADPPLGYAIGLWHDIGKATDAFQTYICQNADVDAHMETSIGRQRVNHSSAGAIHAFREWPQPWGQIAAYCIAGHHAGLADWISDSDSCLKSRLKRTELLERVRDVSKEILNQPFPTQINIRIAGTPQQVGYQFATYTRFLFSALVDADFLATEAFYNSERAADRRFNTDAISAIKDRLNLHIDTLAEKAGDSPVNLLRRQIRKYCIHAAQRPRGLYSLTVPTGGGKTLASLNFALDHAVKHNLSRVIVTIPFTSIIEQNAQVLRDALQTQVLEHHSSIDPEVETNWSRLASENWDANIVVTTNVQFFESLYANRTSRCRKLHNITNSVIILDEAQSLPVELLQPCLSILQELVNNYGCTIVLCSATQPAILKQHLHIGLEDVHEIIPDAIELSNQMKRTHASSIGKLPRAVLTDRLSCERQALCIVNTRRKSAELYQALSMQTDTPVMHMSALMCPSHRSDTLNRVKEHLANDHPILLVSTQLIEAGVDIDFPVVYREIAGIDSIVQAAGRCNREGRRETGHVYIYESEEAPPPGHLRKSAQTALEVMNLHEDPTSIEAVLNYFKLYYWQRESEWDKHQIMDCFTADNPNLILNFNEAAQKFKMIDSSMAPIIIPYKKEGEYAVEIVRDAYHPNREIDRAMQRYTVNINERHLNELIDSGSIEVLHERYHVLVNTVAYSQETGLILPGEAKYDPEGFIL